MAKPTLLPDPTCLHLQLLDAADTAITAVVTTTSSEAFGADPLTLGGGFVKRTKTDFS